MKKAERRRKIRQARKRASWLATVPALLAQLGALGLLLYVAYRGRSSWLSGTTAFILLVLLVLGWFTLLQVRKNGGSPFGKLSRQLGGIWSCPTCSSQNLNSESHCARCGEADPDRSDLCFSCGAENPSGVSHCLDCMRPMFG